MSQPTKTALLFLALITNSCIFTKPIVNGNYKPVQPDLGDFPFHASLMQVVNARKNLYHSFCGGSLIHPKWVLTAAHCIQEDRFTRAFRPDEIHVALGSVYRSGKNAQILGVRKTFIHPSYLRTDRNDIGLLWLKKAAQLGSNVKLIQLDTNNAELLVKKTAYLTGFGVINDARQAPRRLRKAILHISDYRKCTGRSQFRSTEICAASTLAEGKACDGDSGGPLFVVRDHKKVQIGITSYLARSSRCESPNNNSVYTRVSAFISWMTKVTGIDFGKYNQK